MTSLKVVDQYNLLEWVDFLRLDACRKLSNEHRAEMGQFLTPPPIARLMASMFKVYRPSIRLLDAGAGVGTLSAAFVSEICGWERRPGELFITAYEIDTILTEYLETTLQECKSQCEKAGINLVFEIIEEDFIKGSVRLLEEALFTPEHKGFDCAILNPPYRKIRTDSEARTLLRTVGVETSNLYSAFLSLVVRLLDPGGELVAITPRSFCNGPYFKPFRKEFLQAISLRRMHIFNSRDQIFSDDEVLQENLIFYGVRGEADRSSVIISSSEAPEDECPTIREIEYHQVVRPNDPQSFIYITPDDLDHYVVERMRSLTTSLEELGVSVSTGRVVDFRAKDFLRAEPDKKTAPLIYPGHFCDGFIAWPKSNSKKPNAIVVSPETDELLIPAGFYVLVKRFSSKEERRRIVAAIYDPGRLPSQVVGFENHLNYYHCNGAGLPIDLAKGLVVFLNSTLLDIYFRQFNGHTQVNATDLRSLKYPTKAELIKLGSLIRDSLPDQDTLDRYVEKELFRMVDSIGSPDPVLAKKKIEEARDILKSLGLPRQQQNERSALTLLALLDLKPETPWASASSPLCGVTPMMEFFANYYGKKYAPNTRETVRRQTIHQFQEAGIIVKDPDDPSRPVNSPNAVYQIEPSLLTLLRLYETDPLQRRKIFRPT